MEMGNTIHKKDKKSIQRKQTLGRPWRRGKDNTKMMDVT